MMTRTQYLLGKLAEEASEIAQISLKAQQFGLTEIREGQELTNAQRTHLELNDLLAIVEMLNEEAGFAYTPSPDAIAAKKLKVERWFTLSYALGQVQRYVSGGAA